MSAEEKTTEPTGAASVTAPKAHIQLFVDETGWTLVSERPTSHLPSHTGKKKKKHKREILTGSEMGFLGQAIILYGNLN